MILLLRARPYAASIGLDLSAAASATTNYTFERLARLRAQHVCNYWYCNLHDAVHNFRMPVAHVENAPASATVARMNAGM